MQNSTTQSQETTQANTLEISSQDNANTTQLIQLSNSLRAIILGSALTACVLFALLFTVLNKWFLVFWVSLFLMHSTSRLWHLKRAKPLIKSQHNTKADNQKVLFWFKFHTFISACLWGVLGFIAVSYNSPLHSLLVIMAFTGMTATASANMSHIKTMFQLFALPCMVPAAVQFFLIGESINLTIGLLILLYLMIASLTSKSIGEVILENHDLIRSLEEENNRTEAALKEAKQASASKSHFFAAANHDLRQPLQSLRFFVDALQYPSNASEKEKINASIHSSVASLEELMNALLDRSTLDAGTQSVDKQHFHLKHLLHPISKEIAALAQDKNLQFELQGNDAIVYTDPMLLERIVRNLMRNALQYTNEGSINITITAQADKIVRLIISDTGIGIPEEEQHRIYDEFVQLNNPQRDRSQGIGLGLSIVKHMCQLLNISLHLESTLNKGSIFSIDIPLGSIEQLPAVESSVEACNNVDGLFVLIIEDEEELRAALEYKLESWGCIVMLASSIDQAVKQLEEYGSCPDILLTDYRLTNRQTGSDAKIAIDAFCGRAVPTIILTGDVELERLQAIDAMNAILLHKPCKSDKLRESLYQLSIQQK